MGIAAASHLASQGPISHLTSPLQRSSLGCLDRDREGFRLNNLTNQMGKGAAGLEIPAAAIVHDC